MTTTKEERNNEPLLEKNKNKYTLFPIKYPDVYEMYKKQQQAFWTAEEIDFSADIQDYEKLTENEKNVVNNVLAFFAGSDGLIIENLGARFMTEVKVAEIKAFYGVQIAMENIHSEMYSLLIDTYIRDSDEKDDMFNAIDIFPCINKKSTWAMKWIETN